MFGFNLFAQGPIKPISKEEQEKVLDIVKQFWKDTIHELPPVTSKTKVIKVTGSYVLCRDNYTPFDLDYLANLMISKQPNYFVYNYSDSTGYNVIADVTYIFDEVYVTTNCLPSSKALNDIAKFYDLEKVPLISLISAGVSVIDNGTIWIVKGNTRTDLNIYLKEHFSLKDYRWVFLQRIGDDNSIRLKDQ